MKKMKYVTLALILPLLAACNDKNNDSPTDSIPLSITAEVNAHAAEWTWHQGDAIGVYTLNTGTANVYDNQANFKYTNTAADGTTANFSPVNVENTAYYPTDGSKIDVLAYYPAGQASETNPTQITVNTSNQTNLAAIDLMTAAKVTGKSQDAPAVALEFEHRLTKLSITLARGAGAEGIDLSNARISVSGTPMSAVYDLYTQSFASFGSKADIAIKGETAIVVPTPAGSGVNFTVVANDKTFNAPLETNVAFESGKEAEIVITLKADPNAPAEVTTTVKPWTDGPTSSLTAIGIDIVQGDIDIDEDITKFLLWKTNNEADKRTYTLNNNKWLATPAPFYVTDATVVEEFKASATLGQPDPITAVSDELEATGTVSEAGRLRLAFSHIHSQVEFQLAVAPRHIADLTDATIDMGSFTGFKANGTEYLLTVANWTGKPITVSLKDNQKYTGTANFTTEKGKKTIVTITLNSNNQVPVAIVTTTVIDWGEAAPPVKSDLTEIDIESIEDWQSGDNGGGDFEYQ